jgi:UDP-glucose/GDP-mannose dehydrogenase family, central domain
MSHTHTPAGSSAGAATLAGENGCGPDVSTEAPVLVVGLGEVGAPLLEILSVSHRAAGRDVEDRPFHGVRILHLCFPFGPDFGSQAAGYVAAYQPEVTVVNSTVIPGTTKAIEDRTGVPAVYSPVRGKHTRMTEELRHYRKFVAGTSAHAVGLVEDSFAAAGVTTQRMPSVAALELAKLLETSYFGVLVAWAQEMDRFAASVGADYWETLAFFEEIGFFPPVGFQPGFIGGHCVMPNLELLEQVRQSPFIDAIRASNQARASEWADRGLSTADRLSPRPQSRRA